ncbi:protein kinase family protein [Actinocrinis puniceicyclus]|uniref:Protein kinase family protein n=1 Tax=Actinocrinis puniceicyclus TaxID=977794 RepID=A0A8J7WLT4_9ACTN|nr:protein kinase family protein [Actinocrinis puniceicyclus]MBS2962129.1 protein kinase family protein [Actinocrinis puniceicyclus]
MASLAEKPAGDSENFDRARFDQRVRVGARLAGRYRLERELRSYSGGPQPVPQGWVGFDELLNREVGIDLIDSRHPRAQAVEAAARSAATVPDVRFVQVLDVADEEGLVYVVTEWVSDASSLTQRLSRGPLSVALASRIARELAVAIAEAHGCDLRHGALDPDKVILTSTNQVKIRGLCLEAAMSGAQAATAPTEDVRAIGAIWYATLTGRWPGEHPAFGLPAAPRSHGKPFTPAQVRAAIPKAVDQLVEQALEAADAEVPAIDSVKALTSGIAALPKLRDESEITDVIARPALRRPPAYPVATPTAVQQLGSPGGRVGRTPRGVLAAILGIVVVVGAVAAFQLGGSSQGSGAQTSPSSSPQTSSASSAPVTVRQLSIANASIWDSDKGKDDIERLQQSYNGSSEGWVTTTYIDGPDITSYRKGTGIIFDLGSAQKVGKVTFSVGVPGATVEVWTADATLDSLPPVQNSTPPGFTKQVTKAGVGGNAEVDIAFSATVTTRYVMVWFTALPHQDRSQYNIAGYRDSLANVKIYS